MFAPSTSPALLPHGALPGHALAVGAHGAHVAHGAHGAHRAPPDDDALYETADAERLRDAPDSER